MYKILEARTLIENEKNDHILSIINDLKDKDRMIILLQEALEKTQRKNNAYKKEYGETTMCYHKNIFDRTFCEKCHSNGYYIKK